MKISEDWLAVYTGLFIFVLSLAMLFGKDILGWAITTNVWMDVAKALATTEGVADLTEDHWKVVNMIRDYYLKFGIAPMVRKVCKETGFKLSEIYQLFPSGPAKGACKLAGLPKPTGCV